MDLITIITIAFALAMDAFAVSISGGCAIKSHRTVHALRMAFLFGGFQSAMTLAGWATGVVVIGYLSGIDHWIAFLLLAGIGCKMIEEGWKDAEKKTLDFTRHGFLLLLALATSIDALAVGMTLGMLRTAILVPVAIIGAVTWCVSLAGFRIGCRAGHLIGSRAEMLGGAVLIALGLKILIGHLFV